MKTPLYNFVEKYAKSDVVRMHMPGHKGVGDIEKFDITEISGADSLYEADGVIKESETYASELFSSSTFYSAEGSSLCIRAMVHLISLYSGVKGVPCKILAARNVHRSFISALALVDADVEWFLPSDNASYLSSSLDAKFVEKTISAMDEPPAAVYITSPDYLGGVLPIEEIAEVCHRYGVLLAVDNAHGAYLKFLNPSQHPIDLGADICCDSAHKTLPVLTGGAYLHISDKAPEIFCRRAKEALALFGSTSPSYLVLSSLDSANGYIASGYTERLMNFKARVDVAKSKITDMGYELFGAEALKITILAKRYGYSGYELGELLCRQNIIYEFCDPDYLVLMLTPENTDSDIDRLLSALSSIERREPIEIHPPSLTAAEHVMTVREAIFSDSETVCAKESIGRVLAAVSVGCPPAVPIVVSGEMIDESSVCAFEYYGIKEVSVVK